MTEAFDLSNWKDTAAVSWEGGYGQGSFYKKDQEFRFENAEF